jgi:hypothetical protein
MKTKKHIASYAAGLFDGEGYVGIDTISRSNKSINFNLGVRVIISQKDGLIMNWLKDNFGGNVYQQRNGSKYFIYRWRLHSKKAVKFLETIYPYAIIKKPQIKFAIKFDKERDTRWSKNGKTGKDGKFSRTSKEEIELRNVRKQELSNLKKVFIEYKK